MLRYLLDTDHLTLFHHGHPLVVRRVAPQPPGEVATSVVSLEEALRGRLAVLARPLAGAARIQAYALLVATLGLFQQFPLVPFDQAAETHFQHLRGMRLRACTACVPKSGTADFLPRSPITLHSLHTYHARSFVSQRGATE